MIMHFLVDIQTVQFPTRTEYYYAYYGCWDVDASYLDSSTLRNTSSGPCGDLCPQTCKQSSLLMEPFLLSEASKSGILVRGPP